MNIDAIRNKFGDDYVADEYTFIMGIDQRFTTHFAERFKDLIVLETCTGAGFSTIALAKTAKHVFSVEIDPSHKEQATKNIDKAGHSTRVTVIEGNIMDQSLIDTLPPVDAAFIDPDWAVTGSDHVYRFLNSNTQPPADMVLEKMFLLTKNVAIVLPPLVNVHEFEKLPDHELEKLYMGDSHELNCLYFGDLTTSFGETEFRV